MFKYIIYCCLINLIVVFVVFIGSVYRHNNNDSLLIHSLVNYFWTRPKVKDSSTPSYDLDKWQICDGWYHKEPQQLKKQNLNSKSSFS